jgi:hypothetical protein
VGRVFITEKEKLHKKEMVMEARTLTR